MKSTAHVRTLLIAGAILGTWLAHGAIAGAEEAPYKIGWIMSLSGPASGGSGSANLAIQVAADAINAGNLAGRKIELVTGDDASDPKTAAQVCSRMVIEDKVQAIIGTQSTPARLACNQAAVKAGIPFVAASGSAGDVCLPNMFYVGQTPNQFILPLADYLLQHGLKRFYLYGSDYSAPRAGLGMAQKFIEAHGGTVIGISFTPQDTSDFSADIGKIAAAKPDVVLENLTGTGIVALHRQFASDPRVAGIKQADNFLLEAMARSLGHDAEGVYVASAYYSTIEAPANQAFKDAMKAKFGDKASTDYWSVYAYNALGLLAQTVKSAGPDGKAVIAALANAKYDGIAGPISIVNNYAAETTYVGQVQADGNVEILQHTDLIEPVLSCKPKS